MAHREQLEWEARVGRLAALSAFASVALLVAGFIAGNALIEGTADTNVARVQTIAREGTGFLISTGLRFLSAALLAPVLWYLYRATKARRPELPSMAEVLAVGGPLVSAAVGIVFQVDLVNRAKDLTAAGPVTPAVADDFLSGASPVLVGLGFAAGLAIGFALVLISLNAMRAGLLSRFMGGTGIIVGALFVLPLTSAFPSLYLIPVLWTLALGVLFLDKWPGGRGPAWSTVQAVPWPSAAQTREAAARGQDAEREVELAGPASNGGDSDSSRAAPAKRKRKRRS